VLRETTSRGLCGLVCHALVSAGDTEIFKEFVAKKKKVKKPPCRVGTCRDEMGEGSGLGHQPVTSPLWRRPTCGHRWLIKIKTDRNARGAARGARSQRHGQGPLRWQKIKKALRRRWQRLMQMAGESTLRAPNRRSAHKGEEDRGASPKNCRLILSALWRANTLTG